MSGDFESTATFTSTFISSMSGDVYIHISAAKDIMVNINTMSGDITAEFNNIEKLDASTTSMSGSVKNRHISDKGYHAKAHFSTMSGNIRIK